MDKIMKGSVRKGLIALDIDGTVTAVRDHMPHEVAHYLEQLHEDGWQILFVTGRTFHWSVHLLGALRFSYCLGCHNGALLCSMPEKIILERHMLTRNDVAAIEAILNRFGTSGIIYAGPEHGEATYYFPSKIPLEQQQHLEGRRLILQEKWKEIACVEELPDHHYLAIRCSEKKERAHEIAMAIEEELEFPAPRMMDSYNANYSVVQVTQRNATKGAALMRAQEVFHYPRPVIAAGDDFNDIALLQAAEIKIAMSTAPEELLALADVIAPSAKENGIIKGLQEAILKIKA